MWLGPIKRVGWDLEVIGGEQGTAYVIPPPPARAEQYLWLGLLVAKCGFRVRVLSLPTCRHKTITSIISQAADGVRVYVEYSHVLSYAGPGIVVNPSEPSPESVASVARNNVAFRVDWRRCLGLPRADADVVTVDVRGLCNVLGKSHTF